MSIWVRIIRGGKSLQALEFLMDTWDEIDLGDDETACPRSIRPLAERASPRITVDLEDDVRDAPCTKGRSTCPAKERFLAY
jgi:hypothetical protein